MRRLFLAVVPLPHWGFFVLALLALTVSARLIPHRVAARGVIAAPWWDLPARMVVATSLVLVLTAAAAFVGPRTAGMLASFPVFGAILAIFAHHMRGAEMARQVLRGMVLALYGFASFFFVLGLLLVPAGTFLAFLAATAAALLVQAVALRVIRRGQVPAAALERA
ncbi:hypothetical protein GT370_12350 [Acidocella sp. MX-AZ03]|uniref:hypothetical protein n=1 Tax=Acidocella sp. MX-AZ03 TaxID=2697363 RepID=UPI0022DD4FF0|nr:hypothetical protein [Acidocella sp. MX-AZ03]WBO58052.1 hypothetical protein GT370_12350 [Acidocella sp. MX-AZ03]